MTRDELFAGLARSGAPVRQASEAFVVAQTPTSWVVRALLGVMGWFGGLLVLGFFALFVHGMLDSIPGLLVLSISLFVGAYALYRKAPHQDFANQVALAASICAQALTLALFFKFSKSSAMTQVALLVAAMQLALAWWMPNYLHRVISTLFAIIALFFAAERGPWTSVVCFLVAAAFALLAHFENELVVRGQAHRAGPMWVGLALGLLVSGVAHVVQLGRMGLLPATIWTGAAFGFVFVLYCTAPFVNSRSANGHWSGLVGMLFFMTAIRAPSLIACALVLIAAFRSGRPVFVGLSLLALLGTLVGYYYQMEMSLLKKSSVLAMCGAAMLIAWALHRRLYPTPQEGA